MKLTSYERVKRALEIKEPDIVPVMETLVDKRVRDQIIPNASYEDFIDYVDLDGIVVIDKTVEKYDILDETKGVVRDQWGTIKRFTKEALSHPIEPAIASEKDLDTYKPPDPDSEYKYKQLEAFVRRFKDHRIVAAAITDVFNVCQELRGSEQHFMDFIENPDIVDRLNEIVLNYNLKYIRNCIEVGADMIFIIGDYASNKGPMMSPQHFARYVLPPFKAMVSEIKNLGIYCMKHTDGNIWKIFDMIVESGINGIHPLEPVAGMDIGEVKNKYGDKICLMGNVDCGYTLSWGSLEEVRKEVMNCINKAARGGGYILCSSNTIHSSVNPKNFLEMVRVAREYGHYPISI